LKTEGKKGPDPQVVKVHTRRLIDITYSFKRETQTLFEELEVSRAHQKRKKNCLYRCPQGPLRCFKEKGGGQNDRKVILSTAFRRIIELVEYSGREGGKPVRQPRKEEGQ